MAISETTATETAAPQVLPMIDLQPAEVHLKDIRGVRYIGTADVRTITSRDLGSLEVEAKDGNDLTWSTENEHFVGKSQLNAATLAFLLTEPADFRAE